MTLSDMLGAIGSDVAVVGVIVRDQNGLHVVASDGVGGLSVTATNANALTPIVAPPTAPADFDTPALLIF
jgi:hypothetical protein